MALRQHFLLCFAFGSAQRAVPDDKVNLRGAGKSDDCMSTPVAGLYRPFGINLAGRNLSTLPGDDFFEYAGGEYMSTLKIPVEESSWGTFSILDDNVQRKIRGLLEEASIERNKAGVFYTSFLNEALVERLGAAPLQPDLENIRRLASPSDFARLAGHVDSFLEAPFAFGITIDIKNPGSYTVTIDQGGIGLPTPDYYFDEDKAFIKEAYLKYISSMLELLQWPDRELTSKNILTFEERIARVSWSPAQLRDPSTTYNPVSGASELNALAPGFDWRVFLNASGPFPNGTKFVVGALSAVVGIAKILGETDLNVLKAWSAFHLANCAATFLSNDFSHTRFVFLQTLTGQREMAPRWRLAIEVLTKYIGDAVGEVYVQKYFPYESRARTQSLVETMKTAFAARISNNLWMTNVTKAKALQKLSAMASHVGYPDDPEKYNGLLVDAEDLFGNVLRAMTFQWEKQRKALQAPVDRSEWSMPAHSVNAYYNPQQNAVFLPAAILQPPFFDPNADTAVNYGAIGAVIGHEMTHGFDDQGSQFGPDGSLEEWWSTYDDEQFLLLTKRYGEQFRNYDIGLPAGMRINAELTMGENIADLGGLNIALDAYLAVHESGQACSADTTLPQLNRFFMGYAQVWQDVSRPEALRVQLSNDPHAPVVARTNVPVSNIDAWYEVFSVVEGDALFRPSTGRVTIW